MLLRETCDSLYAGESGHAAHISEVQTAPTEAALARFGCAQAPHAE
jgi:hypothetical protein